MSAADRPHRSRLRARVFALALLAVIGLLCGASCTAALGLDPFQNAPAGLCAKIADCYAAEAPDCTSLVANRLTGPGVHDWLVSFSTDTCLDSCASARRCLDLPPLCSSTGGACQKREECCGFTLGEADCVGGVCCQTAGVRCESHAECCSNAGYCVPEVPTDPSSPTTCGGTLCLIPDAPCQLPEQCCSGICKSGKCSQMICFDDGFDCTDSIDCCSGRCDKTGHCGNDCAPLGGVCQQDTDCCDTPCFKLPGDASGVCTAETCLPDDVDCADDTQCCSGYCNPTFFKCSKECVAKGARCSTGGDCCSGTCTLDSATSMGSCTCSNAYCQADTECCSGHCVHGTCAPECATNPACNHSVCTVGGPLGTSCNTCAQTVCALDSYCCCVAWDALCIAKALDPIAGCKGGCQ